MKEKYNTIIAKNIKSILSEIGENPEREGLLKTPERVTKSMNFLTDEIKDCIQNTLNPKGVAVVIDAQHLCMQMRGVEKQHSSTITSAFSGIFMSDEKTRAEFMNLIQS